MALTSGTRLGPYEIVASLGAGGRGEVYRAKDTRLSRDVAIKILPAQFVTADMVPDRVGTWMFHCHIDEDMEMGMMAMYQVLP